MPTGGGKSLVYQVPALVRGRARARRQLAHRAHARSGRRAAGERRPGGYSTPRRAPRALGDRARLPRGRARPAACRAPASRTSGTLALLQAGAAGRHRHRRGALRLAVGAWYLRPDYLTLGALPSSSRAFPAWPSPRPPRRPPTPRSASGSTCRTPGTSSSFWTGRTSSTGSCRRARRQQLLGFIRSQPEGSAGIVYALSRKSVEQTAEFCGQASMRFRTTRACPPRCVRANQSRFARRRRRDVRDHRVRQVSTSPTCDTCCAHRPAQVGRGLLPGDGPRGPRRRARERVARVRPLRRRRPAWPTHRARRRRSGAPHPPGPAPRRDARPVRDDGMPPSRPSSATSWPALRPVRQPRHLPRAARDVGRPPAQKPSRRTSRLKRERGQAFGAGHLIDILRGNRTDRVGQQGTDALATFGIGEDLSEQDWRSVIRQLLARGCWSPKASTRPGAGEASGGARAPPRVPLAATCWAAAARAGPRAPASRVHPRSPPRTGRFAEALRVWRAETARTQGVPAYHRVRRRDAAGARRAPSREHRRRAEGITGIGEKKRGLWRVGARRDRGQLTPLRPVGPRHRSARFFRRNAPECGACAAMLSSS